MNSFFKKALATLLFAVLMSTASLVPVFVAVSEAQAAPTIPPNSGVLSFVHNLEGADADMNTPWPYAVQLGASGRLFVVDSTTRQVITSPEHIPSIAAGIHAPLGAFVESNSEGNHFTIAATLILINDLMLLPGEEVVFFADPGHTDWLRVNSCTFFVPNFQQRAEGYRLTAVNITNITGGGVADGSNEFELSLTSLPMHVGGGGGVIDPEIRGSATWTRGEVTTTPMAGTLTKNLAVPPGVSVLEDMDFAFNFEPVPSAAPAAPNQTAPALVPSPITVTVEAGETSAELNLVPILEAMIAANPSLNAGTVDWIVTEIDTGQAGVTYDTTSQFRLRVHLANQELPATGLRISSIEVFSITPGANPGDDPIETKVDGIAFTNVFTPDTGTITDPALVVSKVIAGDRHYADLTTDFTFTVTLTPPIFDPPLAPPHQDVTVEFDTPLIGTIMPGNVAVPFTINAATGVATATFDLRDGQRLEIPTLPAGTTFSVLEVGTPNFAPSAIVTEAGIAGSVQTPPLAGIPGTTIGQDLTVSGTVSNAINIIVVDGNDVEVSGNAADFTNAYNRLPITGLIINNLPFIAVLAALALAMVLIARNRKRIERVPLA